MSVQVVGTRVRSMFGSIAERYDLTNSVLSFGIHFLWRRSLLARLPHGPQLMALDLCTGTGDLLPELSRKYATVLGADFCLPMLRLAQRKLEHKKTLNGGKGAARLLQGDAMKLPLGDASVDVVTVAFGVRNFENLGKGLGEIRRVMKCGGTFAVLEFGQPEPGLFAALYRFYSDHVMPFIGGLITGQREAYTYLPQTAKEFPSGSTFEQRLCDAGFRIEQTKRLTGGIAYLYIATAA